MQPLSEISESEILFVTNAGLDVNQSSSPAGLTYQFYCDYNMSSFSWFNSSNIRSG